MVKPATTSIRIENTPGGVNYLKTVAISDYEASKLVKNQWILKSRMVLSQWLQKSSYRYDNIFLGYECTPDGENLVTIKVVTDVTPENWKKDNYVLMSLFDYETNVIVEQFLNRLVQL